jgi:hypothetical protein
MTKENFKTMADNELKNKEKKLRNEILESNSNVDSDKLDESLDDAIKAINTAKEEAAINTAKEEAATIAVEGEILAKKIEEQNKKIQQAEEEAEKKALEEEAGKIVKKLSLQDVVKEQVKELIQAKVELEQRVEYKNYLSNIGATKLKEQIKYLQERQEAVKDNDEHEYKKIEIKLAAAKEEAKTRSSIVQGTRRYIKEAFKGFYDDSHVMTGVKYGALVGLAGFAVALTVAVAFPAALPIAAITGTIGIASLGTAGTVALGAVAAPVAGAIAGTALVETVAAVKNGMQFIYNEASIIPNKFKFRNLETAKKNSNNKEPAKS